MSLIRFPKPATCPDCRGTGGGQAPRISLWERGIYNATYFHRCNVCKGTGKRPEKFRPKLP